MHYHIIVAQDFKVAIASVTIDNYEDSVLQWVKLASPIFKTDALPPGSFAIENAKLATDNGEGIAAVVGNDSLCFYWTKCEDPCLSFTWN